MTRRADVCLLLEGTYPYVMGGVSGWAHALITSSPHLQFHIVALLANRHERSMCYELPANVVGVSPIFLDECALGSRPGRGARVEVAEFISTFERILLQGQPAAFEEALSFIERTDFGRLALLDSRVAWEASIAICERVLPAAPLLQFFWTWRILLRSFLAATLGSIPDAGVYHAISTGYAGLAGAAAKRRSGRPLVITEHGIYTNERRIEICLADWLHASGCAGYDAAAEISELRDLWCGAFASFARIAYDGADVITTLYKGNQPFQRADGAPDSKLRVIPNGVDFQRLSSLQPDPTPRRPTVGLIGRVVPIKDIRMFINACALLRQRVPEVRALIIGPEDEDPDYAAECRALVERENLGDTIEYTGRVDITAYLPRLDVLALTSVSEAQPLVILEAGAASVPTVATDVGSCAELLDVDCTNGGAGGIVVGVGDPQAMANAMAELLDDDTRRKAMGAVMRKRVETIYNKDRVDRIYHELYDSMIALPTGRQAGAEGLQWQA